MVVSDPFVSDSVPMSKELLLTISLLFGVILAGGSPMVTSAANVPQVVAENQAPSSVPSSVKLTVADLPPGFEPLPPEIATMLSSKLGAFRQQLALVNTKPEDLFAYWNPESFQIILGTTSNLTKPQEQAAFDATLQQLQKPEVQQKMIEQLQQQLKVFKEVALEVTGYKALPELNKLTNSSTGFAVDMNVQGQPVRMDLAVFRRNQVGAMTAVMYLKDQPPTVSVGDVAHKLDSRIIKSNPSANLTPPLPNNK